MPALDKSAFFKSLPQPWPGHLSKSDGPPPGGKLVVLDDDPTGTQTVSGIPVLTVWDVKSLRNEFAEPDNAFFILTNSRSMAPAAAAVLNSEIARNLKAAAGGKPFQVVSRSDSTLRGHFPLETDILSVELGPFDGILLLPYFEDGGRYTINDTHYVQEGPDLVPAAETPFARDAAFGYTQSNLRDYVEEKTKGRTNREDVLSITIENLRLDGPEVVAGILSRMSVGQVGIVNSACLQDIRVFMAGLKQALRDGKQFMYRTSAEFVSSYLEIESAVYTPEASTSTNGGLVVVGSHVARSSSQLKILLQTPGISPVELDVAKILENPEETTADTVERLESVLGSGQNAALYTSRNLVTGNSAVDSLNIGGKVSAALVEIVRSLDVRPRFLIAKGGITSSDIAARAIGIKRTMILGALIPGVPVWECSPESKFPGMPLVVFPGNVGDEQALLKAVKLFLDF